MKNFACPHCDSPGLDKEDTRLFSEEWIQGSDNLNADPLSNITTQVELWYCCFCGKYFRVYYTLDKITKLEENKDE